MALFDDLQPAPNEKTCVAGRYIATLSDEDQESLTRAQERVSADTIVAKIRTEGVTMSASSLRTHRRGHCTCESA